jgi:hypothetical protein
MLVIDELITLFGGGDTLIGGFIDKLFGVGKAAAMVELVKTSAQSLLDTFSQNGFLDGLWRIIQDLGESLGFMWDM